MSYLYEHYLFCCDSSAYIQINRCLINQSTYNRWKPSSYMTHRKVEECLLRTQTKKYIFSAHLQKSIIDAVIGREDKHDGKIYFPNTLQKYRSRHGYRWGDNKKIFFFTRKSGPPPDFLSVRKIEGFINPGHIENWIADPGNTRMILPPWTRHSIGRLRGMRGFERTCVRTTARKGKRPEA